MAFRITLIDNAVDELNSLRCDLELYLDIANDKQVPESEQHYAIKRSIKQLICAWELLMKYRLQQEDWTQIFANTSKATIVALQSGNFKSVYCDEAIKRLAKYNVFLPFTNLKKLHRFRNQIEHYEINVPLQEVLETLILAIDELTVFFADYIWDIAKERRAANRGNHMLYELAEIKEALSQLVDADFFSEKEDF